MTQETITPGVVFVCDFVLGGKEKFSKYINYIDRKSATSKKSDGFFYDLYADLYMDNELKTHQKNNRADCKKRSALFTACSDFLTQSEKREVKKLFITAQKNGSPLWRNILSFDTKFLTENNLLDSKTGLVDELRLKNITRCALDKLLKNEKMERSAIWVASVHYNTDNVHIHIALAEPHPTRKKVVYKGKEEYRGKYKPSTLKLVKSVVINKIIDRDKELEKINFIIRNVIVNDFRKFDFKSDKVFLKKIKKLRKKLPENKSLWRYNMNSLKEIRPEIDEITDSYVERYHREELEKLLKELAIQEQKNRILYGNIEKGKYTRTKLDELHTKMGNTVLKFLKDEDLSHKKMSDVRAKYQDYQFISNMKKALKKDFESVKNQNAFESLERAIQNSINGLYYGGTKWK